MSRVLYFDSHCHVQDAAFDADREEVLARAHAAGVGEIVAIGADPESAARARSLTTSSAGPARPRVWHTAGLHPHEASRWSPEARAAIEESVAAGAVAVGEIGLDYHYDHSPRGDQRRVFDEQLALARERSLPVVVHSREAEDDTLAILTSSGLVAERIVLHCFTGSRRMLDAAVEWGCYVSFAGIVTFRAFPAAELVPRVPADRLLAETDAPYLAPVPHRGRRNEPAFVVQTVAALAVLCGVPSEEMAARTRANALRFYALPETTVLA